MAEAVYSRSGCITEGKNTGLAVGVSWRKDCLRSSGPGNLSIHFQTNLADMESFQEVESTFTPSNRGVFSKGFRLMIA